MPRYLRWITAITSAIVAEFVIGTAVGAIAIGSDTKELRGAGGFFVTLVAFIVPILIALVINDYLGSRYPIEKRSETADRP